MLNKSVGNMYQWVNATYNVIKGECPHSCSYCYCKKWGKQSPLHFDEKELKTDLGSGNTIFVGSSCDMWAKEIPQEWIKSILIPCAENVYNRYLFQSKNPARFVAFREQFPSEYILGTTIETNRYYPQFMGRTPWPHERLTAMLEIEKPKMVSIEPIIDFDFSELVRYMRLIKPQFVSIGANTNYKVQLPEPGTEKVKALISALQEFTEVKIKLNLKRITERENNGR